MQTNETTRIGLDFGALLDAAPDGIAVVDNEGRILVVNQRLCELFGYAPEELVNSSVEILIPMRMRESHVQHRSVYGHAPARRPMGQDLSLVGLCKDGSELPVEISLSPVDAGGRTLTIAVIRDISERLRLQTEREELRSALDTEQERYRIGMDLHDGIMQDVFAVALSLELVSDDISTDPVQAKRTVDRSIQQLHDVIRDIRSFIFDLRPRQFTGDLGRALADLGSEFQENSSIRTSVSVAEGLPEINPDLALALYLITHEALSNTRKHARAGHVDISLGEKDGRLCLEVRDDGAGFDTSAQSGEGHRGLRNIANRAATNGAELRIESSPGHGTRIEVTYPDPAAGQTALPQM